MMGRYLKKTFGLVISLGCSLMALAVWAAEEGHGGGHEGGGANLWGLVFSAVNFLIFVFILRKYALPAVRQALRRRRETIVQTLNEAERAKEEAESLRREYEQKLVGLAAEQERLRTQALEAAEREKGRILEEARRMADRVQTEAQMIAQREVEEARRVLRQEVAEQAIRIATELVQSRVTPADQSRSVQDLVAEVNNAGNASR
jgi:F-type H+-transporting ATPase subunit b